MQSQSITTLNKQEKAWIIEQRITRLTDNQEVLIYPMGAERYIAANLKNNPNNHYRLESDIKNKKILIIPGHGNTAFLFAHAGAKEIIVFDKDPVTVAWAKAFKKYYHYREYYQGKPYPSIGELLTILTSWYPQLITLPAANLRNIVRWILQPQLLRKCYLLYMLSLAGKAVQLHVTEEFELNKNINFYAGELVDLLDTHVQTFDTAFVPYLLGVKNGIEKAADIIHFIQQLATIIHGPILITPSRNTRDFFCIGQRYFSTTHYANITDIAALKHLVKGEDRSWFRGQGLAVFGNLKHINKLLDK